MDERIIQDIRFYELRADNFTGQFSGLLGNVYQNSADMRSLAQRIARKLNELSFVSGVFDHVYVYLSPKLTDGAMTIQHSDLYKWFTSVHFGASPTVFNSLSAADQEKFAIDAIFKVLYFLFRSDSTKVKLISEVETLIDQYQTELEISYKTKETKKYKIEITYQIAPNGNLSKLLLAYINKEDNSKKCGALDLMYYQDISSLVGTILVKDSVIILSPKKSATAELVAERYEAPLVFEIAALENR